MLCFDLIIVVKPLPYELDPFPAPFGCSWPPYAPSINPNHATMPSCPVSLPHVDTHARNPLWRCFQYLFSLVTMNTLKLWSRQLKQHNPSLSGLQSKLRGGGGDGGRRTGVNDTTCCDQTFSAARSFPQLAARQFTPQTLSVAHLTMGCVLMTLELRSSTLPTTPTGALSFLCSSCLFAG